MLSVPVSSNRWSNPNNTSASSFVSSIRTGSPTGVLRGSALLSEQLFHHIPMHVREPVVAPLEAVRQPRVVEPEQVQDRRLQVMHMHLVARHRDAEAVRPAVRVPARHPGTSTAERVDIGTVVADAPDAASR